MWFQFIIEKIYCNIQFMYKFKSGAKAILIKSER